MRDLGVEAQRAAEAHLEACQEAQWDNDEGGDMESPASAPFCGCDTCVVREVLFAAWDIIFEAAKSGDFD